MTPSLDGRYRGAVAALVAPPLVTVLCVEHGQVGWFVIAAIMAVAGAVCGPLAGWALRHRAAYGVTTHTG